VLPFLAYHSILENQLLKSEKIMNSWKKRNITMVGRIMIVKSLIIPNITYVASVTKLIFSILSLQCFKHPIHIPCVLFLFSIRPENEPNVSIIKAECKKLNIEKQLLKSEKIMNSWKKRNITMVGKIMIVKSLIIPSY
jgi:hypothetical protein